MSRVVGRVTLLAEVRRPPRAGPLGRARRAPPGSARARCSTPSRPSVDALVLRASGAPTEQSMPYAALQDLLDQLPADLAEPLPAALAGATAGLVGAPGRATSCGARSAARFRSLLDELAADGRPVLLLLDDAHWLDPDSACVLGYARRRLGGRVGRRRHRRSRRRAPASTSPACTGSTYPRSTPAT